MSKRVHGGDLLPEHMRLPVALSEPKSQAFGLERDVTGNAERSDNLIRTPRVTT